MGITIGPVGKLSVAEPELEAGAELEAGTDMEGIEMEGNDMIGKEEPEGLEEGRGSDAEIEGIVGRAFEAA